MKPLLIAVLLAIMQAPPPVPGRAADDAANTGHNGKSQSDNHNAAPAPTVPTHKDGPTPGSKPESGKAASKDAEQPIRVTELPPVSVAKDWSDRFYWIFSGLLVIVGFLQVWLLLGTLRAIRRQAELMEIQTGILGKSVRAAEDNAAAAREGAEAASKNAEFSKLNAEATKENAAAAKASAEAARENIDIVINKERARIRIQLDPFELSPTTYLHEVSYSLNLSGLTEAVIVDSGARAYLSDSQEPPTEFAPPMGMPTTVDPKTTPVLKKTTILWQTKLSEGDIANIMNKKAFIHFWGFIRYRDVFGRDRETTFKHLWRVTDLRNFDGTPFCLWSRYGSESDNQET